MAIEYKKSPMQSLIEDLPALLMGFYQTESEKEFRREQ